MRLLVFILLSAALPAHAGLEEMVKDAIRHEIERKMPVPQPTVVTDMPANRFAIGAVNLHWRMAARVGPILYRDDRLEDGHMGRFSFRPQGGIKSIRPENLAKFYLEIRRDF